MKKLPFIGTTHSKLLLIGSTIGIVLTLGLTAFMSLSEAEARSSVEAAGSIAQVAEDKGAKPLPSQDPSGEAENPPDNEPTAAIELPPIQDLTSLEIILAVDAATCIPKDAAHQYGSVIDVIDTDSLSVLIDDDLSTIKYLGIATQPSNEQVQEAALSTNHSLIGQTITLVSDGPDADAEGNLLRYAFTDDAFINQYFLENGLATATSARPDEACGEDFQATQDRARSQKVGIWEPLKPGDWREWPIVPEISDNAVEIYLRGLESSVNPESFSIIGDCLSIPERLFRKVSWGDFELPEGLDVLQSTVEQFKSVWNRQPVTVEGGFVPASVFSSYFSDPDLCGAYETPLDCEFRINNPSIVFISMGTDQKPGTEEEFEFYMREIIEYSIGRDVLPIIVTKADPTEEEFPLNFIMAQLAYEYDLPLWNFWAAVQHLPNTALNPVTGIHLTAEGNAIRRLTALQVLDAVLTAAQN